MIDASQTITVSRERFEKMAEAQRALVCEVNRLKSAGIVLDMISDEISNLGKTIHPFGEFTALAYLKDAIISHADGIGDCVEIIKGEINEIKQTPKVDGDR